MEAADEDTEDDEDARFSSDALQGLSDAILQAAHSSPLDLGLVPRGRQGAAQGAAGCSRQSLGQDSRSPAAGAMRGPAMALRAAVAAKREQAAQEARSRSLLTLLPGLLPADGEVGFSEVGEAGRPSLLLAGLEQIQDDKPCLDTPSLSQAETECSGDEGELRGREVESSDCGPSDDAWGT